MGQADRKMTTMGIATAAAGIEISSLAHGHQPTQQHYQLPPVSFQGEWGHASTRETTRQDLWSRQIHLRQNFLDQNHTTPLIS